MLSLACVLAVLAALVHVYIFVLESLRWQQPSTRRVFGTTEEQAAVTAPLAYNQGFYNLFLALGALAGVLWVPLGRDATGVALVVLSTGSMLAAALVLVTSDRSKTRAAGIQGLFPALTLLTLLLRALV